MKKVSLYTPAKYRIRETIDISMIIIVPTNKYGIILEASLTNHPTAAIDKNSPPAIPNTANNSGAWKA